jgi:hypothetical protein
LILLVPGERIELPTNGLQNRCSTAELTRQRHNRDFPAARGAFAPDGCYRIDTRSAGFCVRPPPARRQ